MNALDRAIEKAKGAGKLAAIVGLSPSAVGMWKQRQGVPDPKSCVRIEKALGIARAELRPNDWQEIWPELVEQEREHG